MHAESEIIRLRAENKRLKTSSRSFLKVGQEEAARTESNVPADMAKIDRILMQAASTQAGSLEEHAHGAAMTTTDLQALLLQHLGSPSWHEMCARETSLRQGSIGSRATHDARHLPSPWDVGQSDPTNQQPIPPGQRLQPQADAEPESSPTHVSPMDPAPGMQQGPSMGPSPSRQEAKGPAASSEAAVFLGPNQAKSELEVQRSICLALRLVKALCPKSPWQAYDTSIGGIEGVRGKVDVALMAGTVVASAQTVMLMELKHQLVGSSYHEAIGQILDQRFSLLDDQKPRHRFLAIVAGCDALEVLVVRASGIEARSGKLSFSWTKESPGLRLLLRVLQAPLAVHGYISTTMPDIDVPSLGRLTQLSLIDTRPAFRKTGNSIAGSSSNTIASSLLDTGQRSAVLPMTRIYHGHLQPETASHLPYGAQAGDAVAIKFSTPLAIETEVSHRAASACQHVQIP